MNLEDVIELGNTLDMLSLSNLLWTVDHNNDVQNFISQALDLLEELKSRREYG